MQNDITFRAYVMAVLKGDTSTATRLSKSFPVGGGILLGLTLTLLVVAPFSLIVHGVHWPRSLVLILILSIPMWVVAVLAVRWNRDADDGDEGSLS